MITQIIKNPTPLFFILISTLNAGSSNFIVEPFSCEVALADYYHLKESTQENNPKFVQEQLQQSLQLTIEALAEHKECGGVDND